MVAACLTCPKLKVRSPRPYTLSMVVHPYKQGRWRQGIQKFKVILCKIKATQGSMRPVAKQPGSKAGTLV